MNELVNISKALGDETRLRALASLVNGEICVCQVTELLQLAPSTVSKHMSILKQAGLVECRKDGRWIHYRWAGDDASPNVKHALAWVRETISDDPDFKADAVRLQKILKMDPEVICRRQRKGC